MVARRLGGHRAGRPHVAQFEPGPVDPRIFPEACKMGLEGIVSKRLDNPYRPGPQRSWVKLKNPLHPAMYRVRDALSRETDCRTISAEIHTQS